MPAGCRFPLAYGEFRARSAAIWEFSSFLKASDFPIQTAIERLNAMGFCDSNVFKMVSFRAQPIRFNGSEIRPRQASPKNRARGRDASGRGLDRKSAP